jgi:protease-4
MKIANGLLADTRNGVRTETSILAYEDVYHNAIKKALKVERKTITKSVSLITRKNDHHWVSTDSKIKLPLSMRREKFKVEKEMSTL